MGKLSKRTMKNFIVVVRIYVFCAAIFSLAAMAQTPSSTTFTFPAFLPDQPNLLLLGDTFVNDGALFMTYNSTGSTGPYFVSRVLFPNPIPMHNLSNSANSSLAASFSTSFVFSVDSNQPEIAGDGIAFIIAPSNSIPNQTLSSAGAAIGLFDVNSVSDFNSSLLHLLAIEYDTFLNAEYDDPDDHHVGLDLNSLMSAQTGSLPPDLLLKSTNLSRRLVTWIDYDALLQLLDVYVALAPSPKSAATRILSYSNLRIWDYVLANSYVGFSASTGVFQERHSLYSWNFTSTMVSVPVLVPASPSSNHSSGRSKLILAVTLPVVLVVLVTIIILLLVRKMIEPAAAGINLDVDLRSDPCKFTYEQLRMATGDFREMLGEGGSARVYRGSIITRHMGALEVAVKRITRAAKAGAEKQFKSEVLTIGRLRHRNLVHLYGWCIERKELMLVYQYMSNGSLDKHLHAGGTGYNNSSSLGWPARFSIIKDVAAALVYLHGGWEKKVIHRDVKASNVMLDADFNARLGDFGLARSFDHDQYCTESLATGVAGTWGYMAPEYAMSGRVTTASDMFSFGILALEIVSGKRPFLSREESLLDYAWRKHEEGEVLQMVDARILQTEDELPADEMRSVLYVGLLCTLSDPTSRLSAIQALQMLRNVEAPEIPATRPMAVYVQVPTAKIYGNGVVISRPGFPAGPNSTSFNPQESLLSQGR